MTMLFVHILNYSKLLILFFLKFYIVSKIRHCMIARFNSGLCFSSWAASEREGSAEKCVVARRRVQEHTYCRQRSQHGARQNLARPADTGRPHPQHRHLRLGGFRPERQRGPPRSRSLGSSSGQQLVGSGRARAQATVACGLLAAARARLCCECQARRCTHGLDVSDSQKKNKKRYICIYGMPCACAACAHDHCMLLHAHLCAWRVCMCRICARLRSGCMCFLNGSIFVLWKYILVQVHVVPVCVSLA
jgi:hypothetical protein